MWPTTFDAGDLHVRFDERDVETEPWRGYSGTARRKGRQQTNRTYCHRATSRLYRSATVSRRAQVDPSPEVAFVDDSLSFPDTLWTYLMFWAARVQVQPNEIEELIEISKKLKALDADCVGWLTR
jgi:hypothetical protein